MFAGRDDNMRSFMKELYEAVVKDMLGVRQGMRELRRTEVDTATAYLDEWLPNLFGGFMTVSRSITKGEGEEGFSYNFSTPDSLKDYTYGPDDILAMTGRLAGSYFQGNMFIDDYIDHRLEMLGIDLEVLGRWNRHIPNFVQPSATPHSRRIHQALRGFQSATEEGSYAAQQHLDTAMGGDPENITRVPSHEAIESEVLGGEGLLRKQLTEALSERLTSFDPTV